jgi:hypothetical protein
MTGAPAATAPYLAATAILLAAGVAKLVRPNDTARALQIAGLPSHRILVRLGAPAEVALASAALLRPGPVTGSLVAAAYAGFAGFVLVALIRGWPLSSCGCFGRPDTRSSYGHAALNAGAAAAAGWWAGTGPATLGPLFYHQPWHGAPLALVSAVITALAYLVWTNPIGKAVA